MDSRLLVLGFFVGGVLGFLSNPAWFIAAGILFALYVVRFVAWLLS